MKIVSKEDFMKVWEDTSREQILNQFYYDYKTLREEYKKWNELKKWLENQIKELNPRELEISQFNIQNDDYTMGQYNVYQNILEKMQELEGKGE